MISKLLDEPYIEPSSLIELFKGTHFFTPATDIFVKNQGDLVLLFISYFSRSYLFPGSKVETFYYNSEKIHSWSQLIELVECLTIEIETEIVARATISYSGPYRMLTIGKFCELTNFCDYLKDRSLTNLLIHYRNICPRFMKQKAFRSALNIG